MSRELIPGFKNLGLTTWAKEAGYCTTGPCMYGNKPCKTQWTHMEVTVSFHKLKHVLCFLFFAGPVTCIYCLAKRQPFVKVTLGLSYKPWKKYAAFCQSCKLHLPSSKAFCQGLEGPFVKGLPHVFSGISSKMLPLLLAGWGRFHWPNCEAASWF